MTETRLTKKIIERLRKEGWWVLKLHGGPMQRAGVPDLLIIRDGVVRFLEVKLPGAVLTRLQQHTMQKITEHGAPCFVVRSVEDCGRLLGAT